MANDLSFFTNRLRGVQTTFYFPLVTFSTTDPGDSFTGAAAAVIGDIKVSLDGAAFGNAANLFAHLGEGIYSLTLTASEMDASQIMVTVKDQTIPHVWKDRLLLVETSKVAEGVLRQGIAQSGNASVITLDTGASALDDYYNGALCIIASGTGAGQARVINDYVGASRVATLGRAWVTNPDATSAFILLPGGSVELDTEGVASIWGYTESAEPTGAIPSLTTMAKILQYLKRFMMNRNTSTSDTRTTYQDNSVTVLQTQSFTTDGTTMDLGKAQ